MPNPQPSDVHVDGLLTNVAVEYKNQAMIGRLLFPKCPVTKSSDKYAVFGTEEFNIEANNLRAPGDPSQEVDFTLSTDSFSCKAHAEKIPLPDETVKMADNPINPRVRFTNKLMRKMLLDEEYALAAQVQSGTYMTQNVTLAGVNQWSDKVNSDPEANVDTAKAAILLGTSMDANTIAMGYQVWQQLKAHPDLKDVIKYSQKGILTQELVAEFFGVDQVIVGKCLYNTAKEGQTRSLSYVWGKNLIVAYVEPNPSPDNPTLGYTFMDIDHEVTVWRDEDRKSTMIRCEYSAHQKIVDAKAGYLIINAVA
jgi:hypothetical protein